MALTKTKNGKVYEVLRFPMKVMNITQGNNGQYSHQGVNALDIAGKDTGIDPTFAPCAMTLVAYDSAANGNAVFFQSNNQVLFADGTVDYATFMFIHDNYIDDIKRVKYFSQWQEFGDEGTAGRATGNHCHFEVAKGKYTHMYDKASTGVYHLPRSISADKACVVDGVTIVNGGGMSWKKADDIPGITKVVTVPSKTDAAFRVYKTESGEHLICFNRDEAQKLVDSGRIYEGVAWTFPKNGTVPVYRLFSSSSNMHHLTANEKERDNLVGIGWKNEGVLFKALTKGIPVYRLYNPKNGDHLFTTSLAEKYQCIKLDWKDEGIGFYV